MKNLFILLAGVILLWSCSNSEKQSESTNDTPTSEPVVQETSAIEAYMVLKDALVQTDATSAKEAANTLGSALSSEEMEATLIEAANVIANSDDVEIQRASFKTVTDGLIASLKANGSEDGVFVQYCPMAFNDTGASWLSLSEEIRNPYFGDMMLKCGKVEEKL